MIAPLPGDHIYYLELITDRTHVNTLNLVLFFFLLFLFIYFFFYFIMSLSDLQNTSPPAQQAAGGKA